MLPMVQLVNNILAAVDPKLGIAIDWNTLLQAIIALAGLVATGIFSIYMSKLNSAAKQATANSEETKKFSEASAASLGEIHKAVNGKDTLTAKKIEDLQLLVLKLTEQKATSDAQLKGIAVATEVERLVAKERVIAVEHPSPLVENAVRKTEAATNTMTESQIAQMIEKLNSQLEEKRIAREAR